MITVTNRGTEEAVGVEVYSLVPDHTSTTSERITDGGHCPGYAADCHAGDAVHWYLGYLPPGERQTVGMAVVVDAGANAPSDGTLIYATGDASDQDGEGAAAETYIRLHYTCDLAVTFFLINNGAAIVRKRSVTLNNEATGNPTHYMASESSSFSGATWNTYSMAPAFTLSTGYGIKTVYFKVKNDACESEVVSDTINFKPQPPKVTMFRIADGATSTRSRTVTLNNTCTKNPTHYKASENPALTGVGWKVYSTAPTFRLSAGNGTKTVYFQVKNDGGKSPIVFDTIQKN
jgi:hypothetical protein